MFRDSDYKPPVLHSTYIKKDVPAFQLQGQISRFDEEIGDAPHSARYGATVYDPQPKPVPSSYDTYYDPSNPAADWSGLVSKNLERKHERGHRSQATNIVHSEKGLMPSCEDTKEFYVKRRDSGRSGYGDSEGCIIGGIPTAGEHFKTTYQTLTAQERTDRDQLTLEKRSAPRKSLQDRTNAGSRESSPRAQYAGDTRSDTFYRPGASNLSRSLIGNIGASLVNRVHDFK